MKEVFVGEDGQHYYHVKSANGQILVQSEGYVSASNAERGYHALCDAMHGDVLAHLRAGTIVESEESRLTDPNHVSMTLKLDASEALGEVTDALAMVAVAGAAASTDGRRGRRPRG